ncbi:MAG: hypothetical protein BAJALOKI2v1_90037 [Promethearchaeota archaeon]|nr:MAG: hypothetical protein BAJALOKI2v1_90037 [Candidatus Lokiarchaeota archaeon]
MGKKKKKPDEEYSLDNALKASKKTESDLQGMLKGFSSGEGFFHKSTQTESPSAKVKREEQGEDLKKSVPQLSHEVKKEEEQDIQVEEKIKEKRVSSVKKKPSFLGGEDTGVSVQGESEQGALKGPSKPPSAATKVNIYAKLGEFFEELFNGWNKQYDRWENSVSNILSILRKSRRITKKNSEELVVSINNVYGKIKERLDQFKLKREEVERMAEVDIESMSGEFRKVLGLLELQVKEYQLKRETDAYFNF